MRLKPALPFLYVTIFLDLLGLGLVVPIAPQLVTQLGGSERQGAVYLGLLVATYGIVQFLAGPVLGSLSDRYGRRPILLASVGMLALDYLTFALTPTLWLLFVTRAVAGALSGTYIVANAYIVDITPPPARARAFGMVGALFSLGFVAGPALGGLLGGINLRLPFFFSAALAALNVCYGLVALPESLPRSRRRAVPMKLANPLTAIGSLLQGRQVRPIAWARLLTEISRQAHQVVWILFATFSFHWGPRLVGVAMAFGGLVGVVVQAFLTEPIVRSLGLKRTVVAGTAVICSAFLITGVTPYSWTLWPLMAVGSVAGVVAATAQSWVTQVVGDSEQGRVQGAWASISSFTEMAVPIPASALFAWSITVGRPGLVFVCAAAGLAVATWLAARAEPPGPVAYAPADASA